MVESKTVHAVVAGTRPETAAVWASALRGGAPLRTRVPAGFGRESFAWHVSTIADEPLDDHGEVDDLVCRIEDGYREGDLLHVCLPSSLSRIHGGAQVKGFSVDFAGESALRIPLAATGVTRTRSGEPGPHRLAACVRNMFREERVGFPGLVTVTVAAR